LRIKLNQIPRFIFGPTGDLNMKNQV